MQSILREGFRDISKLQQQLSRLQQGIIFLAGDSGRSATGQHARVPATLSATIDRWLETNAVLKRLGGLFIELTLTLDTSWEISRKWEYSKLYYAVGNQPFSEEHALTFRLCWRGRSETVRIEMPSLLRDATYVRLRVDPNPAYCGGTFSIDTIRCLYRDDGSPLSRSATLQARKERVRKMVNDSEQNQADRLNHSPHSLSVELTPRCNFTCSHCSSHGTHKLHRQHNQATELSQEHLEHLGRAIFSDLTSIGIVGRGEPLAVSRRLWNRFSELLIEKEVFLAAVTNGVYLTERIRPNLLPHIDSITVSIDGVNDETFARNRGGANLLSPLRCEGGTP